MGFGKRGRNTMDLRKLLKNCSAVSVALWAGNVGHDMEYLGSIGVDALGGETEDHREERKFWQVNGGVVPPTDKGGAVSAGNSNTG